MIQTNVHSYIQHRQPSGAISRPNKPGYYSMQRPTRESRSKCRRKRFRADLRVRKERNHQDRAAQLALHEEKKRYVAEWIAANGTPEQRERHSAGVLPLEEAVDAITDQAFAPAADRPLYTHDGAERLQAHLRRFPHYANVIVTAVALVIAGSHATKATAAQWEIVQQLRARFRKRP